MGKFYCNICEEEVSLKNGKCPNCDTNWDEIIGDILSKDSQPVNFCQQENNKNKNAKHVKDSSFWDENKNAKHDKDSSFWDDEVLITDEEIKENIDFYIEWSIRTKIFAIIVAVIIAIISLIGIAETNGLSLLLLFVSGAIIWSSTIFENNLKWKAYMLHTNMNKKSK